ncbi:MAG: DUF2306 domain-containing protein [Chloroflexi bacterium]|nr:MAG: DUF2306 domain-containing protein [Chloroflexota bacterium]
MLVAVSGLWMNFFCSRPAGDGESLLLVWLIFGLAMLASILLAVFAIRRRDFPSYGAWMTRGYAMRSAPGPKCLRCCRLRPDRRGRRAAPHGARDGGLGDQPRGG